MPGQNWPPSTSSISRVQVLSICHQAGHPYTFPAESHGRLTRASNSPDCWENLPCVVRTAPVYCRWVPHMFGVLSRSRFRKPPDSVTWEAASQAVMYGVPCQLIPPGPGVTHQKLSQTAGFTDVPFDSSVTAAVKLPDRAQVGSPCQFCP